MHLKEINIKSNSIKPLQVRNEVDPTEKPETMADHLQSVHEIDGFESLDLQRLEKAYLTHHFHCCAFKYPEQHNPTRHAEYEHKIREFCSKQGQSLPTDTGQADAKSVRKKRSSDDSSGSSDVSWKPQVNYIIPVNNNSFSNIFTLRGSTIAVEEAKPVPEPEIIGSFHNPTDTDHYVPVTAGCGGYSFHRFSKVKCYPEPNALNPCEDIMGSYYLRISVWFVVVLAMLGNLAVIVVIVFSSGEVTVSRFLICNLAFADFCMGLYLLLIASMDLHSVGTYFNSAFDWQYGLGCQMAGFLTMFASQLSIFTLTVVTVERWFAIAYAMYLTRRIRLGLAAKIMLAGWIYSICMALIPLLGVSNYSSTSICLPMDVNRPIDKAYLISIIVINGLAFALIVFCYAHIYFSLGYETRRCSTKGEMTIAKKMALLVFTDFVCWAPIAFFSLTALAGYPLIGITRSKILLVFFYPLNSCANPYLYAIMTAQYRKDFFTLLYRCGIWTKDKTIRSQFLNADNE
ncbi:glycoprotein hormone receptor [Holotrichia oblita]|uniref:Glycoprotein hormone receptor n=1 Tax=Holotrichia oblita TaxID=644536 RepID=A0ACB9TQC2_HOLOL|nr:glycoprotein hormone receptor [Holotrichia oblita]